MKACNSCKRMLPLTEYSRDSRLSDGHRNDCKECLKIIRNTPKNKQREREWQRKQVAKYAATRRKYRVLNRDTDREYSRKSSRANRKQRNTHARIYCAIRRGQLIKPKYCQGCGAAGIIQGHHEDYNKPLDVIWLCPRCHKDKHLIQPEVACAS